MYKQYIKSIQGATVYAPSGLANRRWYLARGYQPTKPFLGSIDGWRTLGCAAGTKIHGSPGLWSAPNWGGPTWRVLGDQLLEAPTATAGTILRVVLSLHLLGKVGRGAAFACECKTPTAGHRFCVSARRVGGELYIA